jgi:LPXTG-motif cell wall-anchored protein
MSVIINFVGVLLIVLTGWFFFMKKERGAGK